ncbi:hypothetical protein FA10DRAFT_270197 [Acaromyces ingoldii]|uniref:Uncharacterized protein n=1 Tax=Acaromyces ingoldii TaxID=215250 RepID=A0A316YB21_9BASI|nr:hypothetical protein FA10DRAFT_270197 [Acaromyces ingoldii]PWN86481.1 hypothetical protein FA10DRAFT_270197 [Acaromyces ingoldii]
MTRSASSLRRKLSHAQQSLQHQIQSPAQRGRALLQEAALPGSKDLAELTCLLLLCAKLRRRILSPRQDCQTHKYHKHQQQQHGRDRSSSDDADRSDFDPDEGPPAYDEVEEAPPPHSSIDRQGPLSVSRRKDHIWHAYLYQAVIRLQLFVHRIVPEATERAFADVPAPAPDDKDTSSARELPASYLPPLDVCIAWAATIGQVAWSLEPGESLSNGPRMNALDDWVFPLSLVATHFDTTTCRLRDGTGIEEGLVAESNWERLTGTPFYTTDAVSTTSAFSTCSSSLPASVFHSDDRLPKALIIACPQPGCSFQAPIDIVSPSIQDVAVASLRRSQRGLAQPGWRRGCKQCGTSTLVELDTLAGAQLINDLETWCQDETFVFCGLEHDVESGIPLPRCYSHALAAHLLTPLFGKAMSPRRRKANEAYAKEALSLGDSTTLPPLPNVASFTIGERETSANSLSSAMHAVTLETISTTASELGASCDYHLDKIVSRLESDVLMSQPRIHQSRNSSMHPKRMAQTPQSYGGGIGAGGPTFNLSNPLEEGQATSTSAMLAAREEALLSGLIRSLTRPYETRRSAGVVGAGLTLHLFEGTSQARQGHGNEVLLGVAKPVKEMLVLANQLDKWATTHAQSQSQSQSLSFSQRAANEYSEMLESLASNEGDRLRSKVASSRGKVGDGWVTTEERASVESKLSRDDSFGARLGWTAHVLFRGRRPYVREMVELLGVVPRHSWKRVTEPGTLFEEDTVE